MAAPPQESPKEAGPGPLPKEPPPADVPKAPEKPSLMMPIGAIMLSLTMVIFSPAHPILSPFAVQMMTGHSVIMSMMAATKQAQFKNLVSVGICFTLIMIGKLYPSLGILIPLGVWLHSGQGLTAVWKNWDNAALGLTQCEKYLNLITVLLTLFVSLPVESAVVSTALMKFIGSQITIPYGILYYFATNNPEQRKRLVYIWILYFVIAAGLYPYFPTLVLKSFPFIALYYGVVKYFAILGDTDDDLKKKKLCILFSSLSLILTLVASFRVKGVTDDMKKIAGDLAIWIQTASIGVVIEKILFEGDKPKKAQGEGRILKR